MDPSDKQFRDTVATMCSEQSNYLGVQWFECLISRTQMVDQAQGIPH